MSSYVVYIHTSPSGKRYVGITCTAVEQRWRQGKGYQRNKYFSRKQRMRENHAGGNAPKQVLCVETGEIYKSINDAARAVNINKKVVSNCCRGIIHYNTAGGYHWQFI